MDTRNRSAIQRTIDNERLRQQRQQEILPSASPYLQQDQNMSNTNEFAARILVKGMKPLDQFSGAEEQDINVWIQDFEETVEAAGGDSATKRKAVVLYLSGDAKKWYRLTEVVNDEWSTFREKLITAFTSASQQLKAMTKLMNRKQGVNELAQSYFYDILALCSKFNPQMNETEKLLHLLRGVKPSLAQSIIMFNPKTMQDFLELAKRSETTYTGAPSLLTTTIEETEITALIDDENSSEQVAAISHRGNYPPAKDSQVSNNRFQHQNFSQYAPQPSTAAHAYPTDRSSYLHSPQSNPSYRARTTFRQTTHPVEQQPTSQPGYTSQQNNYTGRPEVMHHRQYFRTQQPWTNSNQQRGPTRNRCYNCSGFGHLARVCPSDSRQHQYLNE